VTSTQRERGTLDAAATRLAADRLLAAIATRQPCPPVRDLIGAGDIAAAYAVQRMVQGARLEAGSRVVGRKIGLTSPAVQQQLGVDQPDFGILLDDMSVEESSVVAIGRLLQPRVEAEVAFVLAEDLSEGSLSLDQVGSAIDYAVAALEICDSRITDWDITFGDTVADNASAGLFVLGSQRRTLQDFSPKDVTMTMTVTAQEMATGTGAACLGDPLVAVQWLARQARDFGEPLLAGQVILSGALGPMRPVIPGAEVTAVISGLGEVSVRFSEE
jgi:2-keto-4-pentenoate hydratase